MLITDDNVRTQKWRFVYKHVWQANSAIKGGVMDRSK